MWFLTFVYKNLTRRPLRSFLTLTAIAIAIGSFLTLVGISTGFEHSFLQIYENAGVDIIVVRKGGKQRLNTTLDESIGVKIKELPGVKDVIGGLADMVALGDSGVSALVNGWEPESHPFTKLRMVSGRNVKNGDRNVVVLGHVLAENLGKGVGDTLEVIDKEPFTVIGVYESPVFLDNGAMVMPLKELQRIMDRDGKVVGFSIIMDQNHKDEASIKATVERITPLAHSLLALTPRDLVQSTTEIRLAKAMAWLTSLIALLIGTFGMMNTMIMSIHERTREIGTLRAVGWLRGRVIRMILLEALVLSVVGALVGTLGSILLLQVLTRLPIVNGLIAGRLDPLLVFEGLVIAIAVGILGGLLPARRAARLLPVSALRHE